MYPMHENKISNVYLFVIACRKLNFFIIVNCRLYLLNVVSIVATCITTHCSPLKRVYVLTLILTISAQSDMMSTYLARCVSEQRRLDWLVHKLIWRQLIRDELLFMEF